MPDHQKPHSSSFLPLTPAAFEILLALTEEACHGYLLMQKIENRAGSAPLPGTLYRAIARLLQDGFIEECASSPDENGDQRRRYYRLTSLGSEVLKSEARRLEQAVEAARRRHLLEGPEIP